MIEQAFSNFASLTQAEKIEFLTMLVEHKALLHKVLPDAPFITYLVTGQGPADNPLIQAYRAYLASLTNPL